MLHRLQSEKSTTFLYYVETLILGVVSEHFHNSQNENDINEDEKNAGGMKCLVLVCT